MSAASTSGILQVGIVIYCIIIPAGCVWSVWRAVTVIRASTWENTLQIYIMSAYLYILAQRPRGRRLQESCPFWIDQKKHLLYGPCLNNIGVWPQSDLLIRILHLYNNNNNNNNIWCIIVSPTINALWWRFSHVFGIRSLWFTPQSLPIWIKYIYFYVLTVYIHHRVLG